MNESRPNTTSSEQAQSFIESAIGSLSLRGNAPDTGMLGLVCRNVDDEIMQQVIKQIAPASASLIRQRRKHH